MVSRIHAATAEDFCKLDEPLFDAYPSLRGLSIITRIHIQVASGSPRGFVLVYPSLDVEKLTTAPCLARLREMSLTHCNLGPERMRLLASSPHVRNLNWLVIVDHQNKPGADHMAEDIPVADDGLAALASSPHFARLDDLLLWYNRIGPRGAHALAHSPHLKNLKSLTLGHNPLGDEGARALAEGPSLAQLEGLVLHHNGIGPQGAEALARSPSLTRLKNLTLGDQRLGRRGMDLLRKRFGKALHADEESAREPD